MLDWSQCSAVERASERVSGAWVFTGTRVPVRALFENLEEGASVDEFLQWFPGVTRDQAVAVLAHAEHTLIPACGRFPRRVESHEDPVRSRHSCPAACALGRARGRHAVRTLLVDLGQRGSLHPGRGRPRT